MTVTGIDVLFIAAFSIALITPYVIYPLIVRYVIRPVERGPVDAFDESLAAEGEELLRSLRIEVEE